MVIRGAQDVDASTLAAITAVVTHLHSATGTTADAKPRPWAAHARATAVRGGGSRRERATQADST
jgi:hypothetical protein